VRQDEAIELSSYSQRIRVSEFDRAGFVVCCSISNQKHQGHSNRMPLAAIFSQNRRMKVGGLYRLVAAAVLKSIMARTQIDPVTYMKPKTSNV
jgi:hypothetical protein